MRLFIGLIVIVFNVYSLTIKDINDKYFNYKDSKLKSISFQFFAYEIQNQFNSTSEILLKNGYIKQSEQLKNISINVIWKNDSEPNITNSNVFKTGNAKIDSGITEMISAYNKSALGFTNQLRGLIKDPMIYGYDNEPEILIKKDSIIAKYIKKGVYQKDIYWNNYINVLSETNQNGINILLNSTYFKHLNKLFPKQLIFEYSLANYKGNCQYFYNENNILPDSAKIIINNPSFNIFQTIKLLKINIK